MLGAEAKKVLDVMSRNITLEFPHNYIALLLEETLELNYFKKKGQNTQSEDSKNCENAASKWKKGKGCGLGAP